MCLLGGQVQTKYNYICFQINEVGIVETGQLSVGECPYMIYLPPVHLRCIHFDPKLGLTIHIHNKPDTLPTDTYQVSTVRAQQGAG